MSKEKHITERQLIEHIAAMCPGRGGEVLRHIGDDCAVLRVDEKRVQLVSTDALVQNVHFSLQWHPAADLGEKIAAVNLSDIAAMGGTPKYCLLSAAIPEAVAFSWLESMMSGFIRQLSRYGVALIGGDTVKSDKNLMFSVTILGECLESEVLYRSTAKAGDVILVSGELGNAAAGLELCRQGRHNEKPAWSNLAAAHLSPVPQVELGRVLAESGWIHAMMDISDGIATDLAHICKESGVGAEIDAVAIPISEDVREACAVIGKEAFDLALQGGEDFHLLFTASRKRTRDIVRLVREKTGQTIFTVGRITSGRDVCLCFPDGARKDITYQGYDHFS